MRTQFLAIPVFCVCNLSLFAQQPASSQNEVYIDDDDQRSLADLQFTVEDGEPQNLRINVSALGPNVEPIAGFRGIHGTNRYTAEELELILKGQHEAQVVTRFENGPTVVGRIVEGRYGPIPERRLLPNGRIDFLAETRRLYPLNLIVDPATSTGGRRTTLVYINGQPRLRCRYDIVDGFIRDLEVQSLGNDKFLAARQPLGGNPVQQLSPTILTSAQNWEKKQVVLPKVDLDEWKMRDLEGKWVLITRRLSASSDSDKPSDTVPGWIAFLKQHEEYELLEWMALYVPDAFKSHEVGATLADADVRQWIRVAAWHSNSPPNVGHTIQHAYNLLMSKKPGHVEHWLKTHEHQLDNWEVSLGGIYKSLQKDKTAPQDSSRYLPALQPKNVFRGFDHDGDLAEFGNRKQAEKGVFYKHQMVRAINGVVVSGRRNEALLTRLRQLITFHDEDIRHAALMAHTYILPKAPGTDKLEDFRKIIDDTNEPPRIREAALMAYSYQKHPAVILKLHEIAADPTHAAWKAAVSRLGDIGESFSIGLLQQLKQQRLNDEQLQILNTSMARLTKRTVAKKRTGWGTSQRIVLTVFADQVNDPHAEEIREWMIDGVENLDAKSQKWLRNWKVERVPEMWLPRSRENFLEACELHRGEILGIF